MKITVLFNYLYINRCNSTSGHVPLICNLGRFFLVLTNVVHGQKKLFFDYIGLLSIFVPDIPYGSQDVLSVRNDALSILACNSY
jgi:hypothetical protein